jgi:hypothetical protein
MPVNPLLGGIHLSRELNAHFKIVSKTVPSFRYPAFLLKEDFGA